MDRCSKDCLKQSKATLVGLSGAAILLQLKFQYFLSIKNFDPRFER
jgi:hypothetical protein